MSEIKKKSEDNTKIYTSFPTTLLFTYFKSTPPLLPLIPLPNSCFNVAVQVLPQTPNTSTTQSEY